MGGVGKILDRGSIKEGSGVLWGEFAGTSGGSGWGVGGFDRPQEGGDGQGKAG